MDNKEKKFWTSEEIDKKGKRFNIVLGARTVGKSYHMKKTVLENYFRGGEKFVWLRKDVQEAENSAMSFLGDMIEVLDKLIPTDENGKQLGKFICYAKKLVYKQREDEIEYDENGEELPGKFTSITVGWFISLKQQSVYKSFAFQDVTYIIYDEFLSIVYGRREVFNFLELIGTVERLRDDLKIYMLSNAITFDNPYFTQLEIDEIKGVGVFNHKKKAAIQILDQETVNIAKEQSKTLAKWFGGLNGGLYNEYAYGGKFAYDDVQFVEKYKGKRTFLFNVRGTIHCSVWRLANGKTYFANKPSKDRVTYILATDEYTGNEQPLNLGQVKAWVYDFPDGGLQFENLQIKNMIKQFMSKYVR